MRCGFLDVSVCSPSLLPGHLCKSPKVSKYASTATSCWHFYNLLQTVDGHESVKRVSPQVCPQLFLPLFSTLIIFKKLKMQKPFNDLQVPHFVC